MVRKAFYVDPAAEQVLADVSNLSAPHRRA